MVLLITGVILMMLGIFRFTIYKEKFNKPVTILGFTLASDVISVVLFLIGLVLLLLFLVDYIQPLFYKGRDLRPGITYLLSSIIYV